MRLRILSRAVICVALVSAPATAEVVDVSSIQLPRPEDAMLSRVRAGATLESVLERVLGELDRADRNRDGLDSADIGVFRDVAMAERRASAIGEVLAHDLDGDLIVTREEIERTQNSASSRIARRSLMDRYDSNRDSRIELHEVAEHTFDDNAIPGDALVNFLALDPDQDGRLTRAELWAITERVFATIDLDDSFVVSQEEYAVHEARLRLAASVPQRCSLPPVPDGAQIIVVGAYDGEALSSVAVGGPDQETYVIDLVIDPGSQPIYLIALSYKSMIWRLTGASDRVARFVASSYESSEGNVSAVGLVGLSRDRVSVLRGSCINHFRRAADAPAVALSVRQALGRGPDSMISADNAVAVSIPAGNSTLANRRAPPPPPVGFDAQAWSDATRFWPGGIIEIEPARVVARSSVRSYEVLPSQAGIAQLLGSGALQRTGKRDTFRLVRAIAHLPPGMGGAHSANFVVASGISLPPGDPVHACVRFEDGAPDVGTTCRAPEAPPVQIVMPPAR
jgi:hypothetical protein